MARSFIPEIKSAFLRYELNNGDARRQKIALQEICKCYRNDSIFPPNIIKSVEHSISGILLQSEQDKKVVRWSLNALARLGHHTVSNNQVRIALKIYAGEPEIQAAGIAALTAMYKGKIEELDDFNKYDPEIRVLAALQNTSPNKLDLSNFKIDIDSASDDVLKLALITVGLNKDIQNLFHPKHENGQLVRA